jgi:hypothetical protein
MDHVVEVARHLQEQGLSLSLVSSKFLEASNKVVKAIMLARWRQEGGGFLDTSAAGARVEEVRSCGAHQATFVVSGAD